MSAVILPAYSKAWVPVKPTFDFAAYAEAGPSSGWLVMFSSGGGGSEPSESCHSASWMMPPLWLAEMSMR